MKFKGGKGKVERNWIVSTLGLSLLGALLALGGCGGDSGSSAPIIVTKPRPPLTGSCTPSSSLAVLVQGKNDTSYVPQGNWEGTTTGVSLVQIEGSGTTATVIPTASAVNSCASNAKTGDTVCVANNTDVYLLSGSTLSQTLTSGGSGTTSFSGGSCTNCGVSMDSVDDLALIGLSTAGGPGYQVLNLSGTPALETAFPTASKEISEDALVDPVHKLILSATESGDYELIKNGTSGTPEFFENTVGGTLDSSAEDCQTEIALASIEGTGNLFIADLAHATFTSGSPSGTWKAPSQTQMFTDFDSFSAGTCGIAIAQETHIGVVTGEFGGNLFGAIKLPSTAGGGTPAVSDWVACNLPSDPNKAVWEEGDDPHTVTAYKSPNSSDAIALMANGGGSPPTFLAVVDLTKLLNTAVVKRTTAHVCDPTVDLVAAGVLSFVAVP
jgi:hypothetical protein